MRPARWFGVPSLWVPPPIPSTSTEFFDVTGHTQRELISSLDSSDICAKYGGCTPDPAVPNGVASSLEGETPFGFYCYSRRTTPVPFNVFVLLPRWSPFLGSVTVTLVTRWNALEQLIYVHEAGHATISNQDLACTPPAGRKSDARPRAGWAGEVLRPAVTSQRFPRFLTVRTERLGSL